MYIRFVLKNYAQPTARCNGNQELLHRRTFQKYNAFLPVLSFGTVVYFFVRVPVNIILGNNNGENVYISKYYKYDILQYTQAEKQRH
jgi:hypothetical protein